MMPRSRDYQTDLLAALKDPEEAKAYLEAALEDGNEKVIDLALRDLTDAGIEISQLAEMSGHNCENLKQRLNGQVNSITSGVPSVIAKMSESIIVQMTEPQWQTAHAIARTLVLDKTDVNEFKKVIAYLRAYGDRKQAGAEFFRYLTTLARNGKRIGHSQKTSDYYASIEATCQQYLERYQEDVPVLLHILGWAARLMQYYDKGGAIAEISTPVTEIQSEREVEIQAVTEAHDFQAGQILDAIVVGVKGNKVTYEMLDTIRLTQKEPKQAKNLSEGQQVKVQIVDLREDGSIRKVKYVS